MQPADDVEVREAGGSGGSPDAVGKQGAGTAQAGETHPRSWIRKGNKTVGCTLTWNYMEMKSLTGSVFVDLFLVLCVYIQMKVEEAQEALMEVTRCNTELLFCKTNLLDKKKQLEQNIDARQKKLVIYV